jgi:predicted GNAT family acetyltransferase
MTDHTHVLDNPAHSRYELIADGEVAGYVQYTDDGQRIVLVHTEVGEAYAGRGYGSRVVRGTLDLIRETGRPMVNECPFITRWVARNPEYADLVPTDEHSTSG